MAQRGFEVPYLQAWRRSKLLTQQALANKAGLQVAIVSRVERGSRASTTTIQKLARALGISPTQLVQKEPVA